MPQAELRMAVVGAASDHVWPMGDGLVQQPEVRLVAVAEPDAGLRRRAAGRWGAARSYPGIDELLDTTSLDAVLVCCDNAGKADVVVAAAARGVHVYMDKPMAADLAQARRAAAAARKADIELFVAYHHVFNPLYAEVSKLLAEELLGDIFLARGSIGHDGPRESGCSPEFCAWLFDGARNGGGAYMDQACYVLYEFVDRLGAVAEVSAFTTHIGHRGYLPAGVEDNAVAIVRFCSGALGVIDAKWYRSDDAIMSTSYHGRDGTLTTQPGRAELTTRRRPPSFGGKWESSTTNEGRQSWHYVDPPVADAAWRGREQRQFLDAVGEASPEKRAASRQLSLHVQEVIEAAYESRRTGRSVRLDDSPSAAVDPVGD